MRRLAAVAATAALALGACHDISTPVAVGDLAPDAPALSRVAGEAIPDRYIVVFRDDVRDAPAQARQIVGAHGGTLHFTYQHALRGFAATLPPQAVRGLANNPLVAYVEPDQVVTLMSTTQTNATWGLDRIDQQALPLNSTYSYSTTASNVHAYIIDTGIRYAHEDLGGRASTSQFYDAFVGNGDDGNGHGTHVAGTVGGTRWGVAKGVKLYAVRVLDNNGSGTTSGVIAGVDWVTDNHTKPAVANMSLVGGASTALDDAVRRSIATGVTYVVAAGNGNWLGRQQPACNYSPARVREALTVGATTSSDAKTSWSNYGECVDIFAPGANITSTWHTSNTATNTISGTSMASPHVAGVAALYLAANPGVSPVQVFQAIHDNSTKGVVTNSSTAKNNLLYSVFGAVQPPPPTNQPPTASFTYSCSGLTCQFTDESTDSDGTIASRSWHFGDGSSSTATNPSRTYAAGGTYTVALTVIDNGGATGSTSQSVTVSAPAPGGFVLTGTGSKVQGRWRADLSWGGTSATQVAVFRQGTHIATVANTDNTGSYIDQTSFRGGGTLTYMVCNAGTTTVCSNEVTITF